MSGVLAVGETMALLTTPPSGTLRSGEAMGVGIGGAESNVAIGLARLGVPVTWASRVGDDAFGALVTGTIAAEGVRVRAETDTGAPTGLMIKELAGGRPRRVRYQRAGSAASRMDAAFADTLPLDGVSVVHLTGITAALGAGPRALLHRLIARARAAGALVSVDVNDRRTLWPADRARPELALLVGAADLVFAGPEEAALVLGADGDPETLARGLRALGPATAVLKLGAHGALALDADGPVRRAPERPVDVVDPVGAGDAFVAGYLAALVAGEPVAERLRTANLAGGAVCAVRGDWEGLPTAAALAVLRAADPVDLSVADRPEVEVLR